LASGVEASSAATLETVGECRALGNSALAQTPACRRARTSTPSGSFWSFTSSASFTTATTSRSWVPCPYNLHPVTTRCPFGSRARSISGLYAQMQVAEPLWKRCEHLRRTPRPPRFKPYVSPFYRHWPRIPRSPYEERRRVTAAFPKLILVFINSMPILVNASYRKYDHFFLTAQAIRKMGAKLTM
jgi:hypothetical protein